MDTHTVKVLKITEAEVARVQASRNVQEYDAAVDAIYAARGGKKFFPRVSWTVRVEQASWFAELSVRLDDEAASITASMNAAQARKEAALGISPNQETLDRYAAAEREYAEAMEELRDVPCELVIDPTPDDLYEDVEVPVKRGWM